MQIAWDGNKIEAGQKLIKTWVAAFSTTKDSSKNCRKSIVMAHFQFQQDSLSSDLKRQIASISTVVMKIARSLTLWETTNMSISTSFQKTERCMQESNWNELFSAKRTAPVATGSDKNNYIKIIRFFHKKLKTQVGNINLLGANELHTRLESETYLQRNYIQYFIPYFKATQSKSTAGCITKCTT